LVNDLQRNGTINTLIIQRRIGKKRYTDTYRYASHLPLTNSDDVPLVNWCELVTTNITLKYVHYNFGRFTCASLRMPG
jgi:hypothetical protein